MNKKSTFLDRPELGDSFQSVDRGLTTVAWDRSELDIHSPQSASLSEAPARFTRKDAA